jgi:hypothetical protein
MLQTTAESVELRIDDNAAGCDDLASVGVERGCGTESTDNTRNSRYKNPSPARLREGPVGVRKQPLPTDSLQALSKRELITLLRRKPCAFDDADLAVLIAATIQRLQVLRRRAREGKSVDEAAEFARWLTASGLVKLFGGEAKADVRELATATLFDCESYWRNQGQGPWVAKSELEAVNAKLDNLAGLVASLAPSGWSRPALAVVEGGAAS